MRYRRPNWPGCSRSSASIKRWGAAGNREMEKAGQCSLSRNARTTRRARAAQGGPVARRHGRRMVSLPITLADPRRARLSRLDSPCSRSRARPRPRARARRPICRCRCWRRRRVSQDMPVYLDGVGSVTRVEQRDRALAGRRQADQGEFRRGPGRQEGRRAGRDRSRDLPGAVRSGGRQEGAG